MLEIATGAALLASSQAAQAAIPEIVRMDARSLAAASDNCRHKFDRAFMEILVERLTMANIRLSGV